MSSHDEVHAIVVGSGSGERFGGPKWQLPLAGRRVVDYALRPFALCYPEVRSIHLTLPAGDTMQQDPPRLPEALEFHELTGGATRADSVSLGLEALAGRVSEDVWVMVHDVARPCVWYSDVQRLLAAREAPGALLAIPVTDSVKRTQDETRVVADIDRQDLWRAQTPQMFRLSLLREALREAQAVIDEIGDESQVMLHCGHTPRLVQGREDNIKLTYPEDMARAERILQTDPDDAYWTRL